jgi:alpha-galactosidase
LNAPHLRLYYRILLAVSFSLAALHAHPQLAKASIRFEAASKVFRIDGGDISYVFGVNDLNELQPIYWGSRVADNDTLSPAHTNAGNASFDLPVGTTPQEFAGWGAGLYVEPALKITYPDGNRDLVLHYLSHTIDGDTLTIRLKDVDREIFVNLRYKMDAATGILGRSATIENRTGAPPRD